MACFVGCLAVPFFVVSHTHSPNVFPELRARALKAIHRVRRKPQIEKAQQYRCLDPPPDLAPTPNAVRPVTKSLNISGEYRLFEVCLNLISISTYPPPSPLHQYSINIPFNEPHPPTTLPICPQYLPRIPSLIQFFSSNYSPSFSQRTRHRCVTYTAWHLRSIFG